MAVNTGTQCLYLTHSKATDNSRVSWPAVLPATSALHCWPPSAEWLANTDTRHAPAQPPPRSTSSDCSLSLVTQLSSAVTSLFVYLFLPLYIDLLMSTTQCPFVLFSFSFFFFKAHFFLLDDKFVLQFIFPFALCICLNFSYSVFKS